MLWFFLKITTPQFTATIDGHYSALINWHTVKIVHDLVVTDSISVSTLECLSMICVLALQLIKGLDMLQWGNNLSTPLAYNSQNFSPLVCQKQGYIAIGFFSKWSWDLSEPWHEVAG